MPTNGTGNNTNDNNDEQRQKQGPQPSGTGYVNFDAYFNGNQAAAKHSAQQLENQASGSVSQFQNDLNNTESQFNTDTFNKQPLAFGQVAPTATATGIRPATAAGSTNVGAGAQDVHDRAPRDPRVPANVPGLQHYVDANQQYGGPSGLSNESTYQTTANAAQTAQDYLNNLTNTGQGGVDASGNPTGNLTALVQAQNPNESYGAGLLSSALEGAAGSKDFEALRNQFNPQKTLNAAEAASEATAKSEQALQDQYAKSAQDQLNTLNNAPTSTPSTQVTDPGPTNSADLDKQIDADFAAGVSPDQLVAKYGYAAYDNYTSEQFKRH